VGVLRDGNNGGASNPTAAVLVKTIRDIPLELAPDNDPRKKKLRNAQKRVKNKKRKKVKQNGSA